MAARPPGHLYRFQKLVRRNKLAFAAAAAIAAMLVLGVLMSTWQAIRATRAEREQVQLRQRAEEVVEWLELQRAEDWLAADNSVLGLAALARLLRAHPANLMAAHRLISALTHRSLPLPVFEPLRHQKSVAFADFSPDGRRIVSASLDATAQVWDAGTGQALTPPLRHLAAVNCARFSPDGEKVVTCSDDMTARVWDARSGQPGTTTYTDTNAIGAGPSFYRVGVSTP